MKSIDDRLRRWREHSGDVSRIGYRAKRRNTYFFYTGGYRVVNA